MNHVFPSHSAAFFLFVSCITNFCSPIRALKCGAIRSVMSLSGEYGAYSAPFAVSIKRKKPFILCSSPVTRSIIAVISMTVGSESILRTGRPLFTSSFIYSNAVCSFSESQLLSARSISPAANLSSLSNLARTRATFSLSVLTVIISESKLSCLFFCDVMTAPLSL